MSLHSHSTNSALTALAQAFQAIATALRQSRTPEAKAIRKARRAAEADHLLKRMDAARRAIQQGRVP